MNEDWEGWTRALNSNGDFRKWDNDRIVEGFMTEEEYDTQNDRIHLSAFLMDKTEDGLIRMDWIAKNAVISLVHGKTKLGFVQLGSILGWKKEANKIKIRWGVKKGGELIDWLWKNEIQPRGINAGLSVGGINLEKNCDINQKCDVMRLDVNEVAYTPTPANEGAILTMMNKFAKSKEIDFEDSINKTLRGIDMEIDELTVKGIEDILEKRRVHLKPGEPAFGRDVKIGPKGGRYYETDKPETRARDEGEARRATQRRDEERKREQSEKSLAKSAILKHMMENAEKEITSWTFLKTCKPSQKYANQLDKAGLNFDEVSTQFESMIKDLRVQLVTKGWICECKECGFSHTGNEDCRSYSCPMCGSEMRKLMYPSLMKDEDDKAALTHYNEGDFPEEVPTDEAPYKPDIGDGVTLKMGTLYADIKKEKNKEANNMPDYENMSDEEKKKYEENMKKTSPPASPGKEEKGKMPYENGDDKDPKKKKMEDEEMENMSYSKADIDEMKKSIASLELMIKDMQKFVKMSDDEEENRVDEGEGEKGTGLPVGGEELSKKTAPTNNELVNAISVINKSGYSVNGVNTGAPDLSGVTQIPTPGAGPGGVPDKIEKNKVSNILQRKLKEISAKPEFIAGKVN